MYLLQCNNNNLKQSNNTHKTIIIKIEQSFTQRPILEPTMLGIPHPDFFDYCFCCCSLSWIVNAMTTQSMEEGPSSIWENRLGAVALCLFLHSQSVAYTMCSNCLDEIQNFIGSFVRMLSMPKMSPLIV